VPSLARLTCAGRLYADISRLTSLREVKFSSHFPDSLWALSNIRILNLQRQRAIPSSISRLSRLEKLQIDACDSLQSLPDSLAELPRLNELTLFMIPHLRSLPPSFRRVAFPQSPLPLPSAQAQRSLGVSYQGYSGG